MDFRSTYRNWLAGALGFYLGVLPAFAQVQQPFDQTDLARYRLTEPVYQRFAHAARLITAASRKEPRLEQPPLFTKQFAVSGDVLEMAASLHARLEQEPAFISALFAADI